MTAASFVHLRVHTEYSLCDSVLRIPALMDAVAGAQMPAVALTDQGNLFAMVKFYKNAVQQGIQPILGADMRLRASDGEAPYQLTLLCQNRTGYRNLAELISRSFIQGQQRGVAMIERDWLKGKTDGLIALSGAREGDIGRALLANKSDQAQQLLNHWQALFADRYYLEVQRTGRQHEAVYNQGIVELASTSGTPLVATNDVRFLQREDFEAHEARVCIHDSRTLDDPRRPRRYSEQQYLRTPDEMAALFSDLPEALQNTVEIAKRCHFELRLGENFLPDFPIPETHTIESYLREQSQQGLEQRLASFTDTGFADSPVNKEDYQQRLALELDVITQMGFPGYFLIVADFIRWAKENDVPVGPGRGSGAGSLVAYALGITNLDPIKYDLLFERFLNPERVSMPDFDVDFCMERRDRVIDYVAQRYGREHVSQIITYGSMAARAVVRDVGRVLGHPYGFVDRIAKLIPFEIGMTLDKALEVEAELAALYKDDEEVRALLDLASSLEGLARNAGKHAGGVVIAPTPLTEFTPLYCEANGASAVTQLDKDDVEAVGLVKFDFLGLRTLTIIDWAVNIINEQARKDGKTETLDIDNLPLDDKPTYDLLKRHATTAVFQLESRGMKDLIRRLQPDSFEDIVALVALFRPGPLQSGMVDDFINRKHGRAQVIYPHPALEPVLKPTYGVILYQEQVMQIAQVLAGYTLGAADMLRRAMGKKKPEEMAKQREIFLAGAAEQQVDGKTATAIFDLMEHFAGYGFNKSHSAAYALLSYQTAWLKAHYPAAFMAAVLSSDMDHTDKVVVLIDECRHMDLEILPPDVNHSDYMFTMASDTAIRYGLGAIKGVGQGAIEFISNERANGGYKDLVDFCQRIDLQKANRRALEALIKAGALDALGPNRATLQAQLPKAIQLAEQDNRARTAGQNDMFGLAEPINQVGKSEEHLGATQPDWPDDVRLTGEKETLGLYLTGHPINRYERDIPHLASGRLNSLTADMPVVDTNSDTRSFGQKQRPVTVVALVMDIVRRGGRVSLVLDDNTGRLEATLFDNVWQQYQHLVAKDQVLIIDGKLGFDDFINAHRLTVRTIRSVEQAREQMLRHLLLRWNDQPQEEAPNSANENNSHEKNQRFVSQLKKLLAPHRGGQCAVSVRYSNGTATGRLDLGEEWYVHPSDQLLLSLEDWLGETAIKCHYVRSEPAPDVAMA